MQWLQVKYLNLISNKLLRFKKVQNNYNFRCPICGDSKKSPTKARGWILTKGAKTIYHCFNCSITLSFKNFLQRVDQHIHDEYVLEMMREKALTNKQFEETQAFVEKMKVPEFVKTSALSELTKISALPHEHHAKQFIANRQIPSEHHHAIYFCPKFKAWVNKMIPHKFETTKYDEERIIFPLLDENKELIGIQGRSLKPDSDLKYITVMLDEEKPKIFGLDRIDKNKIIHVFEGPIDSLFIPNSIASCGGSIIQAIADLELPRDKIIIVYDNEPRSKQTIAKIEKAMDDGYKVVLWPSHIKEKDVNDMILSGHSSKYITNLIHKNTWGGLEAKLNFAMWKQI